MPETIAIGILIGILTTVVLWILKVPWKWVERRHQKSKNACHHYEKHYRKYHCQLKAHCVGIQKSMLLDDIYVAIKFLEQNRVQQYELSENAEKTFQKESKRLSESSSDERPDGMRFASDEQYLTVLGGPGVGKSTFLRRIGLEALKGENGSLGHKCTPVFLELKNIPQNQVDIEALITNEFKICGYPYPVVMAKTGLESGDLLILFDGLDEVQNANADNVVRKIRDFVNQYHQNRFIISSRSKVDIEASVQFTVVEIANFDDRQVENYLNNWFVSTSNSSQPDKQMKRIAEQCWKTLNAPEHQAIKALTRNPLLLTMLCGFYSEHQNFPRNRVTFYKQALETFFEKLPDQKYISRDGRSREHFDGLDAEQLLSEIAAKNFEENRFLFKENVLIDQIKRFSEKNSIKLSRSGARQILKSIAVEQWFFVEGVEGDYFFSHSTFQEYLTANYFVSTQSIQQLVADHLHDERWREVFLFTAELLPEGDSLLIAMETEATKCVGTDRLKTLFGWAERITNTTDTPYNEVAKRAIAIHQYFSLWLLNKIYTEVKNMTNRYQGNDFYNDQHREFHGDLYIYQDLGHYRYFYRAHEIDPYLYRDPYGDLYRNLDQHRNHYKDRYPDFCFYVHCGRQVMSTIYVGSRIPISIYTNYNNDLYVYQDPYQYTDTDFYPFVLSKFGDQFDEELDERITLIKSMEQAKIFKGVDLQRMVQRFNAQQKYIKAAEKGEFVEPLAESIHDTWLSVLHITDDMLAISRGEMENYVRYLRAIELTVACKEAAGCVSPKVWQRIEDRFLTVDAEGFEG